MKFGFHTNNELTSIFLRKSQNASNMDSAHLTAVLLYLELILLLTQNI